MAKRVDRARHSRESGNPVDRRKFLKTALAASAGAGLAHSFEERALLAYAAESGAQATPAAAAVPTGKIGDVAISRMICGGNLISGYAHSRDLIYVSSLLQHYFTDEKVIETFRLCEANGINTAMLKYDADTLRILRKYWQEPRAGQKRHHPGQRKRGRQTNRKRQGARAYSSSGLRG